MNLLHGDLGFSFQPPANACSTRILERAPRTLLLALAGYAVGILVGIADRHPIRDHPHRAWIRLWTSVVLVGYAMPSFWVGQLLVIVFSMQLGWLPTQGMGPMISRASGFAWFARARALSGAAGGDLRHL